MTRHEHIQAMQAAAFDAITALHETMYQVGQWDRDKLELLTAWSHIHTAACRELDVERSPAKEVRVKTLVNLALMHVNQIHALVGGVQGNVVAARTSLVQALAELEG